MAPSGYLQVGSPKQKKGIFRPGAVNLRLPLAERHFQVIDGSEENLLTLASSRWTISAVPISSASLYSQASYIVSPLLFSENKLDRRRFGISSTPAQEGPWSRPKHLQSAASSVFVLDLKSATDDANPFIAAEDEQVNNQGDMELPGNPILGSAVKSPKAVPGTTSKEATNARFKKLRMSTRVFGKMLSRLSVYQSSSHRATTDEAPLLPSTPPHILISLPSPGIEMPSPPEEDPKEDMVTNDGLHPLVLEKNLDMSRERTRPSAWKPHRPPSPLPKSMRRHRKHKSEASTLSHFVINSPPPPLPTRPKIASTLFINPKPAYLSFSTPLNSALDAGTTSPVWEDIQIRLKARAMKSSTYAIHDGGIISPMRS